MSGLGKALIRGGFAAAKTGARRGSAEGKIADILVAPGQQIDARDLLMRLE